MPSLSVNGMNCEAVHEGFAKAAEHARNGEGPYLLEMRTYRYKGHSMSDPQKYRTKDEVEEYKSQDPLTINAKVIQENKWMTEKQFEEMDCVTFAEESPEPEPHELYEDVYLQEDYPYVKD
jgi:pyruvate dehydrogenase E1 component alpha subunit